jgi:preprotein translocase subunit YajC
MQVTDAAGGPVGTVKAVQGENLLITTGQHEALLPKTSFTAAGGKLLFGMTQAQLNAEIEKSAAAAQAAIAAGATVKGLQGTEIGKIESVTNDAVVIALPSGKKVQVARTGIRGNADGSVTAGLPAEQLVAQVDKTGGEAGAPQ